MFLLFVMDFSESNRQNRAKMNVKTKPYTTKQHDNAHWETRELTQ